jgi:hypothetical protein
MIYILHWIIEFGWYIISGIVLALWLAFLLYQTEFKKWWEENTEYYFIVPEWMDFTEYKPDNLKKKKY